MNRFFGSSCEWVEQHVEKRDCRMADGPHLVYHCRVVGGRGPRHPLPPFSMDSLLLNAFWVIVHRDRET